jgi:hypothetical protein
MKAAEKATWDLANKKIHYESHMFIENVIFMVWLKEQVNVKYLTKERKKYKLLSICLSIDPALNPLSFRLKGHSRILDSVSNTDYAYNIL